MHAVHVFEPGGSFVISFVGMGGFLTPAILLFPTNAPAGIALAALATLWLCGSCSFMMWVTSENAEDFSLFMYHHVWHGLLNPELTDYIQREEEHKRNKAVHDVNERALLVRGRA